MELPFSAPAFFDVFRQYNEAVWPMQVVLNALAVVAVTLLLRPRPWADRLIALILSAIWFWTGVAYHLVWFTDINPAARMFGLLFLLGGGAFLESGTLRGRLVFGAASSWRKTVGAALIAYALVVYPLLSGFLGHDYPAMPTFGLPCPTVIFTVGLLYFLRPPFPRHILLAPVLWAAIGSQAAFLFGVYQDLGLLVAGMLAIVLAFPARRSV